MSDTSATWAQAIAFRARRQHLEERAPVERMLDVASDLCGLHAQVMSSAELALWARVEGLTRDHVRDALWKRRSLVKIWAMRGTLHLFPSSDYTVWQAALDTYDHYRTKRWSKVFGVPQSKLDPFYATVGRVLEGVRLTREELADAIIHEMGVFGEGLRSGWGSALKPASYQGLLCFAPDRGRNVTFTNPATWLRAKDRRRPAPASEDVLGEAFRRFVRGHGPATREEIARWWLGVGYSPAKVRRVVSADPALQAVDVEGTEAWIATADRPALEAAEPTRTVRMLPGFDQYLIGSTTSVTQLLPDPGLRARIHRTAGWVSPVVTVGGRIEGVWSHERKGSRVLVEVEPFGRRTKVLREGVEDEAERLAAFLDGSLELSWT
jgi:uncharacterized protein YcaQ